MQVVELELSPYLDIVNLRIKGCFLVQSGRKNLGNVELNCTSVESLAEKRASLPPCTDD